MYMQQQHYYVTALTVHLILQLPWHGKGLTLIKFACQTYILYIIILLPA